VEEAGLDIRPIPKPALFLAGKVFTQYRKAGGTRTGVLPDFFIGAHAAVQQLPLLTRDVGRYRSYFPSLKLIAPRPDLGELQETFDGSDARWCTDFHLCVERHDRPHRDRSLQFERTGWSVASLTNEIG